MATLTTYPDSHIESVTVDAWVRRNAVDESWSAIRDHTDGVSVNASDDVDSIVVLTASTTSNQWAVLKRSIFLFDTRAIGSGDTITSATLSLYGTGRSNVLADPTMVIVASTPASNTDVTTADYDQLGTTSYGSVAYASWSTTGYNDITLNTSSITKAGITKLGARTEWDRSNTPPSWKTGDTAAFNGYFADQDGTGTTSDPKLVVVYTSSASSIKTVTDLAKASVKTVNDLAIASVKTVMDLA